MQDIRFVSWCCHYFKCQTGNWETFLETKAAFFTAHTSSHIHIMRFPPGKKFLRTFNFARQKAPAPMAKETKEITKVPALKFFESFILLVSILHIYNSEHGAMELCGYNHTLANHTKSDMSLGSLSKAYHHSPLFFLLLGFVLGFDLAAAGSLRVGAPFTDLVRRDNPLGDGDTRLQRMVFPALPEPQDCSIQHPIWWAGQRIVEALCSSLALWRAGVWVSYLSKKVHLSVFRVPM